MKKLLFLGIPLIMAGVVALGANTVDANYADFEGTTHISDNFGQQSNQYAAEFNFGGIVKKKEFEMSIPPLLLEDPGLQKDIANAQEIQDEKKNFANKIGRGLNLADCSPLAYKNNSKHTQDIFATSFLNDLYVYGDYDPQFMTDSSSCMTSDAVTLTTKIGSSVAVSTGVEATYACITAEASVKVGFSVDFTSSLSESVAIFNYNYYRQQYAYYLPLFEDHANLYKNHLTAQFKADLNDALEIDEQWKYDQFFEKYGTHVIMSAFFGGASTIYGSIISSEIKNSIETKESVATQVKAGLDAGAYKLKATGGTETSFSQGFGVDTAHSQETYYAEYYGGDATPASHTLHQIFNTADDWATTIASHPVCVKYGDTIPVWSLLTDELDTAENAQTLERAFEIYRAERSNYYMSLAYQVQYTDALTYTYKATRVGEEVKVADYWDKHVTYKKEFNLLGSEFFYLPALEDADFNKVQLIVKFTATAKKNNTKLRVKVVLGGHDYGFGYYYSLTNGQETTVTYDTMFKENLSEVLYKDSSVSVEIESNDGGVGSEKVAYLKDIKFDIVYTRPTMFGSGTVNDPYLIYNFHQLRNIENNMEAYYKLAQDVYFSPWYSWEPIPGQFTGSLNGNGYSLKNLMINMTGNIGNNFKTIGIFEQLGAGSYVSNLNVMGTTITVEPSGSSDPLIYAGTIAAMQYGGTIYNCTFENTKIRATTSFALVGTITGYSKGTIRNCTVKGTNLYCKDVIGGITGTLDGNGLIDNCKVTKSTSGVKSRIELAAGDNYSGSYRAGGIAGYGFSSTTKNSRVEYTSFYLTGSITRNPSMGYIIGHMNYANILSSTQGSNSKNSSKSKNFFACDSGKVGKKEGTCTVN